MTSSRSDRDIDARRVLALLDLTNLQDQCCTADVVELCRRARGPYGSTAAVCIWPRFVATACAELVGSGVAVATVVNFPHGGTDVEDVVAQTERCLVAGADEIDCVLPYGALLAGDRAAAQAVLGAVREAAGGAGLKVILETGELKSDTLIGDAARLAIACGADFIKTSTGKTPVSATPDAVQVMLEVIADADRPVGIKPSGGLRTLDDALVYLDLAAAIMGPTWATASTFRFGASSLLDALEAEIAAA